MLERILILGFAVFFTVELVRRLPWIETQALKGARPWACHLCMTFWVTATWVTVLHYAAGIAASWQLGPGAAGVCLAILYLTDAAAGPPKLT